MKLTKHEPDMIEAAIAKHGSAVDAVLNVELEGWPIGAALQLLALMAREIAKAEKARREK